LGVSAFKGRLTLTVGSRLAGHVTHQFAAMEPELWLGSRTWSFIPPLAFAGAMVGTHDCTIASVDARRLPGVASNASPGLQVRRYGPNANTRYADTRPFGRGSAALLPSLHSILVVLALTSNNWSVRKLGGKRWKLLHRSHRATPPFTVETVA
jgi:hypothetical protein